MHPRNQVGSTTSILASIGLGLAALGRPGYINIGHGADLVAGFDVPAMKNRAFVVLDEAWSLGIRYFDVARSYGLAESFLASWLSDRSISTGELTIGSKWGYTYTAAWQVEADRHEVKDHSLTTLTRQWLESREILGQAIDLYQIHSATIESAVLDDRAVLDELGRLKQTGVRIGLSLTGPRQADTLRQALTIEIDHRPLFDCVQATWNLLEPSSGKALSEAHQAGLMVIVKEALANGRLTDRDESRSRTLDDQARRLGTTIDALALASVLARPWVDIVLSGASTVDQLRSNLKANEVRWDDEADEALGTIAESPESYWIARSRMPWN